MELDSAMEEIRSNKIGTTQRGIGPSYSDKCLRIGIRAGDIFDDDFLKARIKNVLSVINLQLEKMYNKKPYTVDELLDILKIFRDNF